MSYYLLIATGLIGPFAMIRYREAIADMLGEAPWMQKLGGVHNVVIIVALLIFFWTVAELTGTTSILFAPLRYLSPGFRPTEIETF